MSLKTSKRILKIFGIFDIICGIFLIILGVIVLVGASQLSPEEIASDPIAKCRGIGHGYILHPVPALSS